MVQELQHHPRTRNGPGDFQTSLKQPQNSSESSKTSPEIVPKPAPSSRPRNGLESQSIKLVLDKLKPETFGQNSWTQTLYNFAKRVLDKLKPKTFGQNSGQNFRSKLRDTNPMQFLLSLVRTQVRTSRVIRRSNLNHCPLNEPPTLANNK